MSSISNNISYISFCAGSHPCYNGKGGVPLVKFDGSKGTRYYNLDKSNTGYIIRHSANLEDTNMVFGSLERVTNSSTNLQEVYKDQPDIEIITDFHEMYAKLREKMKKNAAFAIQDDFFAFKESGQLKDRSKLFIVDRSDYYTHEIFFDDQIDGYRFP